MMEVSANLSKKSLEQWEELDPVSSPESVSSWMSLVEIWSGIDFFFYCYSQNLSSSSDVN